MEGAPGHQAAGIPAPNGRGGARGYYDNNPSAASFAGYPLESYRTWGGFDWMTATVGGLWDSLLAEGRAWWITVNSDSHVNYLDQSDAARAATSRPTAGTTTRSTPARSTRRRRLLARLLRPHQRRRASFSYRAVMDGLRAGRVWVDHGRLIKAWTPGSGSPATAAPPPARRWAACCTSARHATELTLDIDLQDVPNWRQFVPVLKRVDVIVGTVTGPVADKDSFTAPDTRVVKSFEVSRARRVSVTYRWAGWTSRSTCGCAAPTATARSRA